MAPGNYRGRPFLPAILCLIGVAASCGIACYTPNPSVVLEAHRSRLELELYKSLPPASKSTQDQDRIQVTTAAVSFPQRFEVAAVGNFTVACAGEFAAKARLVHLDTVKPVMDLRIYDDSTGTRNLVASFDIDPAAEVKRTIGAHLPWIPKPGSPTNLFVSVYVSGSVDVYNIYLSGPFTSETARAMLDYVNQLHKSLPGETRFVGFIANYTVRPALSLKIDTAKEK